MDEQQREQEIRERAEFPTDGFFASTGREIAKPEHVPHVVTYYRECPPKIALKPATLVEREDVLWLLDQLTQARARAERVEAVLQQADVIARDLHTLCATYRDKKIPHGDAIWWCEQQVIDYKRLRSLARGTAEEVDDEQH